LRGQRRHHVGGVHLGHRHAHGAGHLGAGTSRA
jgi:hypothetical protein